MYKKFEGSYALSNWSLPSLIPKPILSGLGIICSSALSLIPAPNWISSWLFGLTLDINLLGTFFNFNLGSLAVVFSTSSKTVSWAKYGTSVYSFPSESTIDSIEIILAPNNVNVLNLSGSPTVNVWVSLSADIACTDFFNK